jgi:Right handed beta helix region
MTDRPARRESFDADDVRALFQQVQPPPGVGRWREVDEARDAPRGYPAGPTLPLGRPAPPGTRPGTAAGGRRPSGPSRLRPPRRRSLAVVATMVAIAVVSGAIPTAFRLLRVTEAATGGGHPRPARSAPAAGPSGDAPSTGPSMSISAAPSASSSGSPGGRTWPTAKTAGVPAGTALRPHPGDLTVSTPGAVVDGVSVTGIVIVQAPNVTIRHTRVAPSRRAYWVVRQLPGATSLVIEDSELAGGAQVQTGVSQEASGLTVRRTSIHDVDRGIVARDRVSVQDSLLYGLSTGIADQGGVTGVAIVHNAITSTGRGEAAIALYTNSGPLSGVTVDDNLLAGGNYTLYAGSGSGSHDIRVTRNHFSRSVSAKGGFFGPVTAWDPRARGNVWSGNVWDDTGAPLQP